MHRESAQNLFGARQQERFFFQINFVTIVVTTFRELSEMASWKNNREGINIYFLKKRNIYMYVYVCVRACMRALAFEGQRGRRGGGSPNLKKLR